MGRFVEITVDWARVGARADAVVRACPVDIFALDERRVVTSVPEREDECLLCGKCVSVAPDAIHVTRAYGQRRPVNVQDGGADA